ncbi:Hpt domain-containing protein [Aliarcobacter faecis]|uniref:Hpt domain-containing protein n=1 Tax=Aliarcobacter faecis TaxID=1564138 RepID=UPI00211D3896|nr:Hpt domain-containing protein [Aliarcobacter faecis]
MVRHPDSTIPFFRQMWKTILAKNTWQGVIKNRSKNGENYYVHSTIAPILNDKNEIVEFIALREDITNLINRTNELKSEKVILNNFFNHIDEILIIKRDNRFEQISQKFFDLFAIENLQEFNHQYKCISNLFIPKDGYLEFSKEFNWIKEVVNNPNKIYKALMKDKQEKIRTFWVRVQKIPFEKTYYYLFILTDITLLENESLKEDNKNIIKEDIKSENSFQLFEKTKEALKLPDKIIFNLIDKFITNTKETTVKLNEALKSGQIDLVKMFAHNIKGSASTLRFEEISSLAKEIEDNLENDTEQMNKLEKINQLLKIIEEEVKRVEIYDK